MTDEQDKYKENRERPERCSNCTWSVHAGDGARAECHKKAPSADADGCARWPLANLSHWCGEWSPILKRVVSRFVDQHVKGCDHGPDCGCF